MKVALLFRGISFTPFYTHWSNKKYHIDFRHNFNNIKKLLITPLEEPDIYYVTYDNIHLDQLNNQFKPINTKVFPMQKVNYVSNTYVINTMLEALLLIDTTKYDYYDTIILTRFDINLLLNIQDILKKCDLDKINFMSYAMSEFFDDCIDDTLIIFPTKYINTMIAALNDLYKKNTYLAHHLIFNTIKYFDDYENGFVKVNVIDKKRYPITSKRNFILYNREVPYNTNIFILNDQLYNIQYTKYYCDKSLMYFESNTFWFTKHYDDKIDIAINLNGNISSSAKVTFDIEILNGTLNDVVINSNIKQNYYENIINIKLGEYYRHIISIPPGNFLEFKISNININYNHAPKIHFVSFYTQGKPFDKGDDLIDIKNKYEITLSSYFDKIRFYSLSDIPEDYIKTYDITSQYYSKAHILGYNRWKPYCILKFLNNIKDGDILVFKDINSAVLSDFNYSEIRNMISKLLDNNYIFAPVDTTKTIKTNCKYELIKNNIDYNNVNLGDFLNSYMVNTDFLIIKKCDSSCNIIQEWLNNCLDDNILLPTLSTQQYPDFLYNIHDQSIFSVLFKKYMNYGNYNYDIDLKYIPKIAILCSNKSINSDHNFHIFISTFEEMTHENYNIKGINRENYNDWVTALPIDYLMPKNNNLIVQAYNIFQAYKLMTSYEHQNEFKYDVILFDGLLQLHNIQTEKDTLYEYNNILFGTRDTMSNVAMSWNTIIDIINHPYFGENCNNIFKLKALQCNYKLLEGNMVNIEYSNVSTSSVENKPFLSKYLGGSYNKFFR